MEFRVIVVGIYAIRITICQLARLTPPATIIIITVIRILFKIANLSHVCQCFVFMF
jgi:hypothetical protein